MAGGAELDKVTLNSIDYLIKGPVIGQPVAEFETGLKVGRSDYDNREQAFYLVLDDFSGGFGHRRLNIRDALGTFWDSVRTNAPDLRRAGAVTLPPAQAAGTISGGNPTANHMLLRTPAYPYLFAGDTQWIVGFGSGIYTTTDGTTFTRVLAGGADAGQCSSLVEFVDKNGTVKHYAAFPSQTLALTGNARYQVSTNNGTTWANGASDKVIHDMIYWDNKIVGAYGKNIIFGVLSAGTEAWNIDDPNDGEFITSMSSGKIHFVGVTTAPNGEPAIHFTNERRLFWLDFFARKSYPIDLGIGINNRITTSCMWNGSIILSDGWAVLEYNPSSQSVRNIGFPTKEGKPPSLQYDGGNEYRIRHLIPDADYLYAVVSDEGAAKTLLFCYNGGGWSQLGKMKTGMFSNFGFVAQYPPTTVDITARKLHLVGASAYNNTTPIVETFTLPTISNIPVPTRDAFGDTGAAFLTGWIDGGFAEIYGALLRMSIDGWNLSATNTVKVEYQIDSETAGWSQMVNSSLVAAEFTEVGQSLFFFNKQGTQFLRVRFRITLNSGGSTQSPELLSLTIVYNKKPYLRTSWKFTVDVNRMVELGNAANFQTVYNNLKTAWNVTSLLPFAVPNIQTGMLVQIVDMILTADNTRDELDGQGDITVTVLEPVSAAA